MIHNNEEKVLTIKATVLTVNKYTQTNYVYNNY